MYDLRLSLDVTERWQAKGQKSIIVNGEFAVPQSLYARCIHDRIMPRLCVSDCFRLIARADEVIDKSALATILELS
jgi:hypothetical protein